MSNLKKSVVAVVVSAAVMYIPTAAQAVDLKFDYKPATLNGKNSNFIGTTAVFEIKNGFIGSIDAKIGSSYNKNSGEVKGFDITAFSLYKEGSLNPVSVGSLAEFGGNDEKKGVHDVSALSFANASAGKYYFQVMGLGTKNALGSSIGPTGTYTNNMVAQVPEPETYAMFLAGLGVLGFFARRKAISARLQKTNLFSSCSTVNAIA
jgi:hypothetical protein